MRAETPAAGGRYENSSPPWPTGRTSACRRWLRRSPRARQADRLCPPCCWWGPS